MRIKKKRVFVSGCFDMLHSGHITFLESASKYGYLTVAVGSDKTITALKGRPPVTREEERLAMVRSIRWVDHAFISNGSGELDFQDDMALASPDLFIVNDCGGSSSKKQLCRDLGIEYKTLPRRPAKGIPARSTSELRKTSMIPYRLDLAGGWLDHPSVSGLCEGSVVVASLEPSHDFESRSGLASSTRDTAFDLWGPQLPDGDLESLAKVLFCQENPPGSDYISGSQDAIGIVYPYVSRIDYSGHYWPKKITSISDEDVLRFVEYHTSVIPLGPRNSDYDVFKTSALSADKAKALSEASAGCWEAIRDKDLMAYAKAVRDSFEAQAALFPNTSTTDVARVISQYPDILGCKLAGAGGGGYLVAIHEEPLETSLQLRIRRDIL